MRAVHKYQLRKTDQTIVSMPKYAQIVHVGMQNDNLIMWAVVDTENPPENRVFNLRVTGGEVAEGESHVATFIDDWFVGHVFEETER